MAVTIVYALKGPMKPIEDSEARMFVTKLRCQHTGVSAWS